MSILIRVLKTFASPFIKLAKSITESIDDRKKMNVFQSVLRKAAYAGSPFLRYYLGHKINNGLMFMLQTISFFTTLAGANYYLRGINGMAPLLFATTIQLGLFYHASSYTDSEARKLPHLFVLTLFTAISIVFSYTGMAVTSFPPEQEYEIAYNDYHEKANAAKSLILESNSSQESIDSELHQFLAKMENRLQSAQIKISSLDAAIAANDDIIANGTTYEVHNQYDPVTGAIINRITVPVESEAANQAKLTNTQLKTDRTNIEATQSNLDNALKKLSLDKLKEYVMGVLSETEKNETAATIYQLIDCHNTLAPYLDISDNIETDYIDKLSRKYKDSEVISSISISSFEDVIGKEITPSDITEDNWLDFIYKMIHQESSAASALKKLTKLKAAVNSNYLRLEEQVTITGADKSILTEVQIARQTMNSFGDPNVQVLMYLADAAYQNRVMGIFVLALLVDGLTFLLGIINRKKHLSLLDPSTNKELIDNEEQLFSIIFVSLVGSKLPDKLKNTENKDFKSACIQYVNNIKTIIHNFLNVFKNSPWTGQWGYGLYADYEELQKVDGSVTMISILHQLGYLQFLSYSDFDMLKASFNGAKIESSKVVSEKYVCILRYRVEMYLHSNTAEISTMFLNEEFGEVS